MRWNVWTKISFPAGASDIEIDGVDLISIDTFAAGCISTFVGNQGKLDQEIIDILRTCTSELDLILGRLTGDIKDYFTELSALSHKILKSANRRVI